MAKIKSLRFSGVTLPTGHVVPGLGELVTDNETLTLIDVARVLPALISAGEIAVEYDPAPVETLPEPVAETPAPKLLKGA